MKLLIVFAFGLFLFATSEAAIGVECETDWAVIETPGFVNTILFFLGISTPKLHKAETLAVDHELAKLVPEDLSIDLDLDVERVGENKEVLSRTVSFVLPTIEEVQTSVEQKPQDAWAFTVDAHTNQDGSKGYQVEFVTPDPFTDVSALSDALTSLEMFAHIMITKAKVSKTFALSEIGGEGELFVDAVQAEIDKSVIIAAPQVTVGVRVDRLYSVFKLISSAEAMKGTFTNAQKLLMDSHETFGNGDSKALAFLVGNVESSVAKIKQDLGLTADPSEELKGYLVLLATYLHKASKAYVGGAYSSAKIIAPVMSRTILHKPFTKLTQEEQTALKANNAEPFAKLLWHVCSYSGSKNSFPWKSWSERNVYQRCSTDDSMANPAFHGYIIPKGQKGNEDGKMGPAAGPLVLDFIKGLTEGKDLMQIQTMGKLDKFEDVGGHDGYILEFRRMPSMPHNQWKDAFVSAYTFLSAVNDAASPQEAQSVQDATFAASFIEQSVVVPAHSHLVDQTKKAKKLAARVNKNKA